MTCQTPADTASVQTARIAPTPRSILDGLALLRRLDRALNDAEAFAFDAQDTDIPADAIGTFAAAEEIIAEAGRALRREIRRLEQLSRGVFYVKAPRRVDRFAIAPADGQTPNDVEALSKPPSRLPALPGGIAERCYPSGPPPAAQIVAPSPLPPGERA